MKNGKVSQGMKKSVQTGKHVNVLEENEEQKRFSQRSNPNYSLHHSFQKYIFSKKAYFYHFSSPQLFTNHHSFKKKEKEKEKKERKKKKMKK
jgi:hypothetical protein